MENDPIPVGLRVEGCPNEHLRLTDHMGNVLRPYKEVPLGMGGTVVGTTKSTIRDGLHYPLIRWDDGTYSGGYYSMRYRVIGGTDATLSEYAAYYEAVTDGP